MQAKRTTGNCDCQFCKNNLEFELPSRLLEDIVRGDVVLFAGAGISTEGEGAYPVSFYDEIRGELNGQGSELEFPDLMSHFCQSAGGRTPLVKAILDRFKRAFVIRETYRLVTRFHQTLSTLFPIDTIVTTNWDDFFERETDALPFVIPEDMAFWNLPGRKVLKIHGSISNLGTLIATREDYTRCSERLREGILGSVLKTLLASRTVIYVGYSLRDPDFLQILDFVQSELGEFAPRGFLVSASTNAQERAGELGLAVIHTDANYFFEVVKQHLIGSGQMFPDEKYPLIESAGAYVTEKHRELAELIPPKEEPAMVLALSYQDGLMSAFDGIIARRRAGTFSKPSAVNEALAYYARVSMQKFAAKQFHDVAYIDGFAAGFTFFRELDPESPHPIPLYYIYGRGLANQPATLSAFREQLGSVKESCPEAFKQAQRIVDATPEGIVIHHRAWL